MQSPRIQVFSNDRAAARALARRIAGALAQNPRLVLGLPTGKTPVSLYHELASIAAAGHADFIARKARRRTRAPTASTCSTTCSGA